MEPPPPNDEADRLAVLEEYRLLDTEPGGAYDDIVRLTSHVCGTPIAAVSLIDDHRQWYKAALGLTAKEVPRELTFCDQIVFGTGFAVIPDAQKDPLFFDHPAVTGPPHIRFYASVALVNADGYVLGSLFVADHVPRQLTPAQVDALRTLARQAMGQMEHGRRIAAQEQLVDARVAQDQRVRDAAAVLEVQKAKLETLNADLEAVNEVLEALATTDPLTGLLNHRAFQTKLADASAHAQNSGRPMALALLDLDGFRFFNDVYGHAVGDAVLCQVADRITATCGPAAVPARFGGDEFIVLFPSVTPDTLPVELETRLREGLCDLTYQPPGEATAIPLTASVGAALYPQFGLKGRGALQGLEIEDPVPGCQAALRRAEERLWRAKTGGEAETEAGRVRAHALRSLSGFSMLDALVTAVDNKDRYTRRHSEDVLGHALLIARELGLTEAEQRTVAVAALLHDVGKIGIPDAVLRKPGGLSEAEYEAVRRHPQMGAMIVQAVPGLEDVLDAVCHHHERWDGGGYPFGLRGTETPLTARLLSVADAFSAMTTDRPYRRGMDRGRALSVLEAGAGTQWDRRCVEAFLAAYPGGEGIGIQPD